MLNSLFLEVSVPMLDQFCTQVICFVDAKYEFFSVSAFTNIFFEISRIEEIRITSIDNLQKHIRFFNDSPELYPDLNILLEWSECQLDVILFDGCDISSPLEERHVFLLMDFCSAHLLGPCWSSWNLKRSILRIPNVSLC